MNALKGFRPAATRYDKRGFVIHGTVTLAAIRLWIRQRSADGPQAPSPQDPPPWARHPTHDTQNQRRTPPILPDSRQKYGRCMSLNLG
jgi:hypothetical protein